MSKKLTINTFNSNFSNLKASIKQSNLGFISKYSIFIVLVITAVSINISYSMSMMLLTTFTLAYLSKGSRRK